MNNTSTIADEVVSIFTRTLTDSSENSDLSEVKQTVGIRYHSYVLDASSLKLGDLARETKREASLILEATLSLLFLKDNRAWNALYPHEMEGQLEGLDVDRVATILDSWYSQYAGPIGRMFSFIQDFMNVTDVLVSPNDYVIVEVGEEYELAEDGDQVE